MEKISSTENTMNKDKLPLVKKDAKYSLAQLKRALDYLEKDPKAHDRDILLDAVAKRFEMSFEYMWKALKAASEFQGTEAPGPRPAITNAITYGWIKNPEIWITFLEARNSGVHDYHDFDPESYAQIAREFLKESTAVVKRLP